MAPRIATRWVWVRARRAWAGLRAWLRRPAANPISAARARPDVAKNVDAADWRWHLTRGAPRDWLLKVAAQAPQLLRAPRTAAGADGVADDAWYRQDESIGAGDSAKHSHLPALRRWVARRRADVVARTAVLVPWPEGDLPDGPRIRRSNEAPTSVAASAKTEAAKPLVRDANPVVPQAPARKVARAATSEPPGTSHPMRTSAPGAAEGAVGIRGDESVESTWPRRSDRAQPDAPRPGSDGTPLDAPWAGTQATERVVSIAADALSPQDPPFPQHDERQPWHDPARHPGPRRTPWGAIARQGAPTHGARSRTPEAVPIEHAALGRDAAPPASERADRRWLEVDWSPMDLEGDGQGQDIVDLRRIERLEHEQRSMGWNA